DNTQDVEEVVVKEDPQPSAEEIRQQQETERLRQEQEEAERIRREEEAERQRQLEAERQRQLEEQRRRDQQANRLNRLGENTFGNQGTGEQEGSEGVAPGSGTNQGTTTGTEGASNYGAGSGLGDGPSYGGLGNRKAVGDLPLPNVEGCEVTSRIVVTVAIQVDRSGNVTSATVSSATFADKCIWDVVVEAAKKTKFSGDPNAPFKQSGWIKYTIEP
ncbi:MAG TPA: hypothetical protein VJ951_12575, partial [Bacteroidales bacterium]|nr:hypothetical protein [Bacteroidales bacterium]